MSPELCRRPLGRAAGLGPVPPCSRCGTEGGYIPKEQSRPERRSGGRYGFGPLCKACFSMLRYRAAPSHGPPKVFLNPDERAAASKDGSDGRRRELLAEVRAQALAYEECDVDPLALPWRAAEPSGGESPPECPREPVARLLARWREGDAWGVIEEVGIARRCVG